MYMDFAKLPIILKFNSVIDRKIYSCNEQHILKYVISQFLAMYMYDYSSLWMFRPEFFL